MTTTSTGAVTPAGPGSADPATPRPFRRSEQGGHDVREAAARLEELYGGRRFRLRPGVEPFRWRYASAGDDRLSLRTATVTGHLEGDVPWSSEYVMSWFRHGRGTLATRGSSFTTIDGEPFLLPAEASFSFTLTPHRNSLVHVSAEFLEQVATERHGGPAQRVLFARAPELPAEALAAWRRRVSGATAAVVDDVPPLVRLEGQLTFARAMLDLFPWRAVDVPRSIRTPRTARLREAAEYVHAFADQAITSADIADAVGMHTRTLQQAMNTHLGMTPTSYLRQVRLDRAQQELREASPGEVLVSDVARRWGFGNLGRFAAAYRARFGEHPRDTLAG
ncbi:helix-turn-helix transcriptional regulator [Frigoribacterium faeni]|uniref:helix-turn-helix transcriptional regulator n=1 Tax=Frigoribacterium faeni TaxID=145483 RepID=UPI00141B0497|nr:helix-turn-helix transcriptional regulator [Frigoribacterium faeni]NIJ05005.1 AraC-like DNA-binding protein [Frigoribacterium faeni]